MGKRGPRPKSTAVKLARGNPGKRALNENEPEPESAAPTMPKVLTPEAAKRWRSLLPRLKKLGVLSNSDLDTIVLYCETYARWEISRAWLQKHGVKYPVMGEEGRPKFWKPWPEVAIEASCRQSLTRLAAEFGLSPSSRSQVVTKKQAASPLLKFLSEHPKRKRRA